MDENLGATTKWERIALDEPESVPELPPRLRKPRIKRLAVIGLLVAVMLAIVGYVAVTVFYLFSRSWVAPMPLAETDDAVVTAKADLAAHQRERDRIAAELGVATGDTRDALVASLARQDHVIENLRDSAYLRALADHAMIALVPLDNLDHAQPGEPLYACRVEMVLCRQVGRVTAVLPGEVQFRHPHRDTQVRGHVVEIKLDRPLGDKVLFAGSAPLGI